MTLWMAARSLLIVARILTPAARLPHRSTAYFPRRGPMDTNRKNDKLDTLEPFREHPEGQTLTTDQGVRVSHTDDSLRAGARGPTLLEDFPRREKPTRFNHERIPERVVHA